MAHEVKPTHSIESSCFNHQRIALPPTHRISQPGGIWVVLRQRTPVQEYLPELREWSFIKNHDEVRFLDDLKGKTRSGRLIQERQAWRQAVRGRGLTRVNTCHPFLSERVRPWLNRKLAWLEIGG